MLMEIVMLLGGALVMGLLAQRLGQSPILGYIITGTLLGPVLFNAQAVNNAAELGVALLLFSIGLEFSVKQILRMGRIAFGGGSLQIIATMTLVASILLFRLDPSKSWAIGAMVALSSTAMVLRLLVDRSEMDSIRGRTSLSILLLQDIAIVPLVLIVSFLTPQVKTGGLGWHILQVFVSAFGLVAVLYILLYWVIPKALARKALFANREFTVLLATSIGLGAAWSAHAIHLSPALGAFIAGILLGESPYASQIRADIGSLRTIMVTLFFISIGMLAKPLWFMLHLHWILLAAVLIIIIKTGIIYVVSRIFALQNRDALAVGLTLSQVGEFSFVLAAVAHNGGVIGDSYFNLIISVIITLMLATPYLVAYAIPISETVFPRSQGGRKEVETPSESKLRVLIVGLGPAGWHVAKAIKDRGIDPVVVDINPKSKETAEQLAIEIHLGDATHEEILTHAGLANACMVVVTIPDSRTALKIVQTIRAMRPELPIAARCRYHVRMDDFTKAGAEIVVDEESNVGSRLSLEILQMVAGDSSTEFACRLAAQSHDG